MNCGARIAAVLALALVADVGPLSATSTVAVSSPILQEWARARVLTERLRILPGPRVNPGACLEIGAEDLKVRLRGRPVDDPAAVALVRDRTPNIHAILIDTSPSMDGDLEQVAAAAAEYVRSLPLERDRALIATFDHRVTLLQPPTGDRRRLLDCFERLEGGMATSLFDGLIRGIGEAVAQRERPVVVLLTDGHDVGSLHEAGDVRRLVRSRPDLTIFTIAFRAPEISGSAPTGMLASRRLLTRLAGRTGGGYFPVYSGPKLTEVYRRIREMLDSEATLTVIDPEPDAEPGLLSVTSRVAGCDVRILPGGPGLGVASLPVATAPLADGTELPLRPGRAIAGLDYLDRGDRIDPGCDREPRVAEDADSPAAPWFLALRGDRIAGCFADITMERGPLYDPFAGGGALWTRRNPIAEVTTRELRIEAPPVESLPRRPEETLDALAREAIARNDLPIERHATKVPDRLHARPYFDIPSLAHGTALFELRPALARALFARAEYRSEAVTRLREEASRDLGALRRRLARLAPASSALGIRQAIEQSAEAQQIRRRVDEPTEADLVRSLAAWLGDIRAHDLFVRWERLWIERWIAGSVSAADVAAFVEGWQALRRLLLAPSYAHTLTLLSAVRDLESGRVGFYRILLPDLRRLGLRVKGRPRDGDLGGAELDLLPDRPFALEALRELAADRPELLDRIRRAGHGPVEIGYRLRGPARRWFPERAFRESRVTLVFRDAATATPGVRIDAELGVGRGKSEGEVRVQRIAVHDEGGEVRADAGEAAADDDGNRR